jgi:alpha-tubulin suppressor-like RCC1 family protein
MNSFGQVGDGSLEDRTQPTEVAGLPGTPTDIAAGAVHTCALVDGGRAFCWGQNLHGQLGDGSTENHARPVPVSGGLTFAELRAGGAQTCGITGSGDEYCWGQNLQGQLGDGTRVNRSTPTRVAN